MNLANRYYEYKGPDREIKEKIACKITQLALFSLDSVTTHQVLEPDDEDTLECQIFLATDWLVWVDNQTRNCGDETLVKVPVLSVVNRKAAEIKGELIIRGAQHRSPPPAYQDGDGDVVDNMDNTLNTGEKAEENTPDEEESILFETELVKKHINKIQRFNLGSDEEEIISKIMELIDDTLRAGDRAVTRATRDWHVWLEDELVQLDCNSKVSAVVPVYSVINWRVLEYRNHPGDVLAVWKELGGAKEGILTDMDTIQWFRVPWTSDTCLLPRHSWTGGIGALPAAKRPNRLLTEPTEYDLHKRLKHYRRWSTQLFWPEPYVWELREHWIRINNANLYGFFDRSTYIPLTVRLLLPLMSMPVPKSLKYFPPEKRTPVIPPEVLPAFYRLIEQFTEEDHYQAYIAVTVWVHDQVIKNREALLNVNPTNPILSVTRSGGRIMRQDGPKFLLAWFSNIVPVLRSKTDFTTKDIHIVLEPLFRNLFAGNDSGVWVSLKLIGQTLPLLYKSAFRTYGVPLGMAPQNIRCHTCITLLGHLGKEIRISDTNSLNSRIDPNLVFVVRSALSCLCAITRKGTMHRRSAARALRKFVTDSSLYSLSISPSTELELLIKSVEKLAEVLGVDYRA